MIEVWHGKNKILITNYVVATYIASYNNLLKTATFLPYLVLYWFIHISTLLVHPTFVACGIIEVKWLIFLK